jgi:hypothetical protein
MAKEASDAEAAQRRIQEAIEAFLDAIVVETALTDRARAFKLARDALEHFDGYYQGIGDEQQPGTRRRDRSPREDLAQRDSALRLRIGHPTPRHSFPCSPAMPAPERPVPLPRRPPLADALPHQGNTRRARPDQLHLGPADQIDPYEPAVPEATTRNSRPERR